MAVRRSKFNGKDITHQSDLYLSKMYEQLSEYLYYTLYDFEYGNDKRRMEQYILYLNSMVIEMGLIETDPKITEFCIRLGKKFSK